MKNLIIHPQDPTTSFLAQIYAPLSNKMVIDGGITKSELRKLIVCHDRIIMLGHGSPDGLLSVDQFPDAGSHIVNESFVEILKTKKENIFIWCNADKFIKRHGLAGVCSGMFISEVGEAFCFGFDHIEWDLIDQSNYGFAAIMGKYLNEPMDILFQNLEHEYSLIAKNNPIARFNLERLYFTLPEPDKHFDKMCLLAK